MTTGKKTKTEVKYSEGHPNSHCGPVPLWPGGDCKHFKHPNACKIVMGTISPRGWCELWSRKPAQ